MEMPLPDNTLPMMTGTGQFGAIEMGGMFSTVKIRAGLARDDYRDPGPYRNPAGTVAYLWPGEPDRPVRATEGPTTDAPVSYEVRKPTGHADH